MTFSLLSGRRSAFALAAILLVATACSEAVAREPLDLSASHPAEAGPGPSTTTTTAPPNVAPVLLGPVEVAGSPGAPVTARLPVADPDGDTVTVAVADPEPGSGGPAVEPDGNGGWTLTWTPETTGTRVASLELRDDRGGRRLADVTLRATNPASEGTLIGLGDSVASGHGLQKRDYLGRDDCWRSGDEAYPRLVYDDLVAAGVLDAGGYSLVACSGATLEDLDEELVGGGPPGFGDRRTQVDWVVAANPEIVTLTAGANTLGFVHPERLLDADLEVDQAELTERLDRVTAGLDDVLGRLVDETDSVVAVTNYYNPVAGDPQGVDGCRGDCFRARADEVVAAFNVVIAEVASRFPADRVIVVDIAEPFVGHGAPNGLGPDRVRAGAVGWISSLIGTPLDGVHPYCARGHDDDGSWVNYVDCVHPDGRGHREIADSVVAAVLDR